MTKEHLPVWLSGSGRMGETHLHYRATSESVLRAINGGVDVRWSRC